MSLDRLRQVAENATPGPWHEDGPWWYSESDPAHMVTTEPDRKAVVLNPPRGQRASVQADTAHIATFDPPTVKALLDVAERARFLAGDPYLRGAPGMGELRDALSRLREVSS